MHDDHSHVDQNFVHLHLHTEYSLLDGFAVIDRAVAYATQLGMPALAITDHGTMFGVIDFYRACKAKGIKPLIGVESYLARRSRFDRDPKIDSKPYHMLLLAQNQQGYKNLLKLTSAAQLEGYYYRPRIDRELMAQYASGLIATSGCLAAEIPRMVEDGRDEEARQLIGWYQDVFGKDNFFLELQAHDIPQLDRLNRWLVENSKYANVPLVATNDVHYVSPDDYEYHDTLLCIQTGNVKKEEDRLRMSGGNSYYMRTQAEMWRLFGDIAPAALSNTLLIAEMCEDVELDTKEYHLPIFPVPDEFDSPGDYLRYLCEEGIYWRYGSAADTPEVRDRLEYEINVIHDMGFDTYFLIVWDLCRHAREVDIWWNVRGSGAGSVVAYTLGITGLDPLENNLLFERFLNPGRRQMPDFDLDFPEDRRAEMIEYCVQRYGEEKVAAIITFGTLGAKAAIRDVGRAFDLPLTEVDRIARLVPTTTKPPKIYQLLGEDEEKPDLTSKEFIDLYESDQYARQIIDTARHLEGVPRHASTHAAGVIVADKPLDEYLPLHRATKDNDDSPVKRVTQFEMETAESIGLLKIDFLGLSTLTILRRACELIEKHHGVKYDMSNIPIKPDPNDPEVTHWVEETFKMLGRGESIGVFQLESSGMRQMLTGMRPKTFEHIIAAISLYRPGPMQFIPQFNKRLHGEESPVYLHPKLESIIGNTYGIITYQEQIMQIAAELFGYSLGDADLMRRAVSKKKQKDLQAHRDIFMENGPKHGVDAKTAAEIFDQIEFFANYGFNKSHAADYAVITCQTAYLKCRYPHEYMTALMSVYYDDSAKVSQFVADANRMDIDVLPPNVNYSWQDFDIEYADDDSKHIRFGMGAVKNVGMGSIAHILEEREAGGRFKDLDDFLQRCDMRVIGKRALESLIRVGAMDDFGDRPTLLHNLERLMSHSAARRKDAEIGQITMFDLMGGGQDSDNVGSVWSVIEKPAKPADKREQLRWERELTGLYVTDHPMGDLRHVLQRIITHTSADLLEQSEVISGKSVTVAGLVTELRVITTKKGDGMAILQIEDMHGVINAVMFPKVWDLQRDIVQDDKVLVAYGKADLRNGEVQIIVDRVTQNFTVHSAAPTNDFGGTDSLQKLNAMPFDWLPDDEPPYMDDDGYLPDPSDDTPYPLPPSNGGNGHHQVRETASVSYEAEAPILTEDELEASMLMGDEPDEFAEATELDDDDMLAANDDDLPPDMPVEKPLPLFEMTAPVERKPSTPNRVTAKLKTATGPTSKVAIPRQRLVVHFYRSSDDEQDKRTLRHIVQIAQSYPGADELWVAVHRPDREFPVHMKFPKPGIAICDELLDRLSNHNRIGTDAIEVQPL
ncbi:MAG: DNA polymerase III subunit alpha [Chloroflexi bacterium]|nr:DNA polymerase III subunit alpha [Chloroflexota bacterium]